jgi:hypothetical protein
MLIRFIAILIGSFIVPGATLALGFVLTDVFAQPSVWQPIIGFLSVGAILTTLSGKHFPGFRTFIHELSHALVALLFFRRIRGFHCTFRKGGSVTFSDGWGGMAGNLLITLAPYYLPLLCLPFYIAALFVSDTLMVWVRGGFGFFLGYHLIANPRDIAQNWRGGRFRAPGIRHSVASDIAQAGYLTSVVNCLALFLVLSGSMLAVLSLGAQGAQIWATEFYRESCHFWNWAFTVIRGEISGLVVQRNG